MIRRSAAFLAALAAVFVWPAANVQATLIDSFDAGNQSLWVSPGTPYSLSQANVGSMAIGGYRNVAIQWITGRQSYVDVLDDPTLTGLSFTQGTAQAKTTVTWDGPDIPNVLGYSLNANLASGGANGFVLDVAQVTGTGVNLTMTVYTNDASHASVYSHLLTAGTTGAFAVPYTSFSGAASFSDVDVIVLELDGTGHSGSDITINSIKTSVIGVPEPSTLVMTAIGALVFLGAGRRWKRT